MMRSAFLSFLSLALGLAIAVGQQGSQASNGKGAAPALEDLARRAAVIKPSAAELKWQQIPWVLDLAKGQQLAREEKRPIFLWAAGDDPLERC